MSKSWLEIFGGRKRLSDKAECGVLVIRIKVEIIIELYRNGLVL